MFTLNLHSRVPIYEQLEKSITRYISIGVLSPGEQLPSVRALAQELGVNPNTVQRAYRALEQQSILVTLGGKGTFVSQNLSAAAKRRAQTVDTLKIAAREAKEAGVAMEEQMKIITEVYTADEKGDEND